MAKEQKPKKEKNVKLWWLYLVIGILAIAAGIFLICAPDVAVTILRIVISIFFIVSGIAGIVSAIKERQLMSGWLVALILSIAITILGILVLFIPTLTEDLVYILLGIGFFVEGVAMVIKAIAMKKIYKDKSWVASLVLGIVIAIIAIVIIAFPDVTYVIIAILMAALLAIFGIYEIITAVKLKKVNDSNKVNIQQPGNENK